MSMRLSRPDVAGLERKLDAQAELIASLVAEVAELRSLVGRSHVEVLRRLQEVQPATAAPVAPAWVADPFGDEGGDTAGASRISPAEYSRLVTRVRALVRTVVPTEAIVVVASRGDEALVDLDGRTGWHFPRTDDGRYAGFHPKDSAAAIEHLEELRRRGARYLVFPSTGLWWLEHYDDLHRHLDEHYRVALRREDACLIFDLDSR